MKKIKRQIRIAPDLVGKSEAEQLQEDNFLHSLSNLALPEPNQNLVKNNRTSRFWFRLEPTAKEVVEKAKSRLKPVKKEHVDQAVVDRLKDYKVEMPPVLDKHLTEVREFFLTEIAPLTIASAGGALQSREVASRLLDTEIDSAIFGRFDNMVNRAATIKMGMFVLKYFGLPTDHFSQLIGLQQQSQSPVEHEIKKILEHLSDAPNRRDLKTLANSVSTLRKELNNTSK